MRSAMFVALLFIAACAREDVDVTTDEAMNGAAGEDADASASETVDIATSDAWLGDWRGVEGTLLTIAGGQGIYRVTVRDLDGPRSFDGKAVAGGIAFERDGVQQTIRATDGVGTGMKWFADKRDCLAIRQGEGFCRD